MERETGASRRARGEVGGRGGVEAPPLNRGLGIRALQILFVRESATRNRLRGVALLRVTLLAVRRAFSGEDDDGRGRTPSGGEGEG